MKLSRVFALISILLIGLQSLTASADFGEIDLLVEESVANYFAEERKDVDIKTLEYWGEPTVEDGVMTITSSVWAEQRMIAPWWGLHSCTTKIQILEDRRFVDLGSDCYYEYE